MGRELSHADIQQLLGAYALDAVDRDEAEVVDVHLRACPRCRAEVLDHREVAAWMAHAGSPAPPAVWDRIASSLEDAPDLTLAPVRELRPARRGVSLRVAAAAATVAAAVIGVLGVKVVDDGRRIDDLASSTERQQLARAANAALVDPQARRIALRSADQRLTAEAVMLPDGTGYLIKGNLPPAGSDRTYQLWALAGTSKISAGVLGPRLEGRSPAAFKVAGSAVWGLAITQERAGGVPQTQNTPVVVGQLGPEPSRA